MKTSEAPIVVTQNFARSTTDVWNAITKPAEMRKWFFDNIPDFKAEVGFRTQFMVESADRSFLHMWEVTDVVPERRIVYNWKYEEYEGDSDATFELSGDDQSSELTVTLKVLADFPEGIPEFERESGIGGWTYFINDQLKSYLDG